MTKENIVATGEITLLFNEGKKNPGEVRTIALVKTDRTQIATLVRGPASVGDKVEVYHSPESRKYPFDIDRICESVQSYSNRPV